jgi:hypothetical protein
MNDVTYDVFIQWDAGGYQYIISHGVIVDASGYTPISDISENTWVGWDGSYNHFTTFPSAIWFGALPPESFGLTGGGSMILKPYPVYDPTAPSVSSQKKITSFSLDNLVPPVVGVIDDTLHTISVSVPYGTDVTALTPTIQISDGAQILPATTTARDFTSPILYTVSAEDGLSQSYTVAVIIASDTTAPVVTEYTLNTVAGDITVNPLSTPVTLTIKTNENVNWDSIKIEHTTDADVYKSLRSGAGCVDGSMVCTKVWDGTVSKSGTVLLDGQYRVKLHVRDMVGNDFFDYLSPYTITVDQGL